MGYFKNMKAVSINISLNPELADFARTDGSVRAFLLLCKHNVPN